MPTPIDLQEKREGQRPPQGEQPPNAGAGASAGRRASSGSSGTRSAGAGRTTQRQRDDAKLAESIQGLYQVIGASMVGIGYRLQDNGIAASGVKTIDMSEQVTAAWLDLADRNPRVRATLVRLTEVSATGVLIGMHVSMLTPFLIDRNIIPAAMGAAMEGNGNGSETGANGSHGP